LTIDGSNFAATPAKNIVTFNNGTKGKVASNSTTTQLFITNLTGLVGGKLTVTVAANGLISWPEQVATVVPIVTQSTTNLAASATTLVIHGVGFSPTAANNKVTFDNGAQGTVTHATETTLTVTGLTGLVAGSLTASVTTNGVSSGTPIPVATVFPVITKSTAILGINATTIVINGFGFDPTKTNDILTLNNGAVNWTILSANPNQLSLDNLSGLTLGTLTASVKVNGQTSGTAVEAASVRPVITSSTANLVANQTTLTINGFGFSPTATGESVTFSNGVKGKIASNSTATQLFITNLTGLVAGNLMAAVTVDGLTSASEDVAVVVPVVSQGTAVLAPTAKSLVIHGFGFSANKALDKVIFTAGETGTVASATATTLIVTDLTGLAAGLLEASVEINGIDSNGDEEVANVS
jgi:predicted membrane protein